VSEEKFSKCEEVKKCKYRISGVRKKKKLKEKFREKMKMFWVEILLSSCSLVGLYVNLQVKVTGKENGNFQSVFRVGVLKLRLRFAKTGKVGWASC